MNLSERARTPETSAGPTARSTGLARVEAILFLAREPISSRKLAQLANLPDGTRARSLVGRLRRMYDVRGSAFQVEEVAGGFQLLTRRKLAAWLRRIESVPGETRLSAPAMETLAVVAYRQPVLRAEVEAIRGVQCGEILRQLMERDLVRIAGRADELGRPFLYGTTKRFLQLFGLRHLDELPRAQELRAAQVGPADGLSSAVANGADSRNDIESSEVTGNAKQEVTAVIATRQNVNRPEHLEVDEERLPLAQLQDEDELEEEDEEEDDDDDDDEYEYEEDDEEYEEDDEDLEEEEEDDELEGDWEEVEDEEEEEEDEEDEDWEDEDEDWEDEDEEDEEEEEEKTWE